MTEQKSVCQTCSFVMASESSETQFRCGFDYFKQAPAQRHAQKMSNYKSVRPYDSCVHWTQHSPSILRDKFE